MKEALLVFTLLISLVSLARSAQLDYLMVGDFGWTFDMSNSYKNFDAIDAYVGNLT